MEGNFAGPEQIKEKTYLEAVDIIKKGDKQMKTLKRLTSLFMVICMCVCMISTNVYAAPTQSSNKSLLDENAENAETLNEGATEISEEETTETVKEETTEAVKEEATEAVKEETTEAVKEETTEAAEEETTEAAEEETTEAAEEETTETNKDDEESNHIHDYYIHFVWADDNKACDAILSCYDCDETFGTKECEMSVDVEYYGIYRRASAEFKAPNDDTYSDYNRRTILEINFVWASDYSTCKAEFYNYDTNESSSKECSVEVEKTEEWLYYTATVEYEGNTFTNQTEKFNPECGTNSGRMWYRFNGVIDIRGYKNNDVVKTTYSNQGYHTLVTYDNNVNSENNTSNEIYFSGNGVATTDEFLSVTPHISFSDNKSYVNVTYSVENICDTTKTFNLAVIADVDIDNDDYATVTKTSTGVKMRNENTDTNYYLVCKNVSGISNADNLWIGRYPEHWDNAFNNSTENEVTGIDSAVAISWVERKLAPGEKANFSYQVGIGEGTAIQAPEEHYHSFTDPEFEWASDYSTCKAKLQCETCSYYEEKNCNVTSEVVEESDTVEGKTVYKASVVFNDKEYNDQKAVFNENHEHSYGEPEFTWADDYSSCEASYVCDKCGEEETKVCVLNDTDDEDFFVATVEIDGTTYVNIPEITIVVIEDSVLEENQIAEKGVHIIGSGDDLSLECNIPLKYFVSVAVDDVIVDSANYTLAEGSTILTFSSAYLDTLHTGSHAVTMNYNVNGRNVTVETVINIKEKKVPDNGNKPGNIIDDKPNNDNGSKPNNNNSSDNNSIISKPEKATTVVHIVDENGQSMTSYKLVIDNQNATVLNSNSQASFNTVGEGNHTLYLLDSDDAVIATKNIKIEYSDAYGIDGDVVKIIKNKSYILHVKYDGENIILLSVEGASPKTGDTSSVMIWVMIMLLAVSCLVWRVRKSSFRK